MWWPRRGRELFRRHELVVLDAIAASLTSEAAALLERQIVATRMVVRLFEGREVYLYPMRGRRQRYDPAVLFPNRGRDLKLATVDVHGSVGTGIADAHLVDGQLLELVFRPRPRDIGEPRSIGATRVRVRVDPMAGSADDRATDVVTRLHPEIRLELEAIWTSDASTPLMTRDEMYTVHLEDGEYVALAQLDDATFVMAPVEPQRPGVRRFDLDGALVGTYATLREAW